MTALWRGPSHILLVGAHGIAPEELIMNTAKRAPKRGIAILVSAALLASAAIVPAASAREFQRPHRAAHGEQRHDKGNDNAAWIGLGIAALAGAAIIASANQPRQVYAPAPIYAPEPAYLPQPVYAEPAYMQPTYAQPSYGQPSYTQPTCTMINGQAACIGLDGNWQFVR